MNMLATLCSEITLKIAPASGVPIGFPSYKTVVFLANKGP